MCLHAATFTESEQDFPSLGNQKTGGHLRSVTKKNLKKPNSIVPKKAKKKKKKSNSSSESKDSKDSAGQTEKPRENAIVRRTKSAQ